MCARSQLLLQLNVVMYSVFTRLSVHCEYTRHSGNQYIISTTQETELSQINVCQVSAVTSAQCGYVQCVH